MFPILKNLFFSCSLFFSFFAYSEGQMAPANGIEIWYETFGSSNNPAFVLMMGGGRCQGILWPVEFCEELAKEGFYVIRYDNRDAGFSTCINFQENPYTLLDIAKDTIGLLDHLDIEKAHYFGVSMGGLVAKIIAAYYPGRTNTIAFMGSTSDIRPMNRALQRLPSEESPLSRPSKDYLTWIEQATKNDFTEQEEILKQRVAIWRIMSGSKAPFNDKLYYELHKECLVRTKRPDVLMNHFLASALSEKMIQEVPPKIKIPTLIIQGSEDPVFAVDHGEALAALIPKSRYLFVQDLGHVPTSYFDTFFIKTLTDHAFGRNDYYTNFQN